MPPGPDHVPSQAVSGDFCPSVQGSPQDYQEAELLDHGRTKMHKKGAAIFEYPILERRSIVLLLKLRVPPLDSKMG